MIALLIDSEGRSDFDYGYNNLIVETYVKRIPFPKRRIQFGNRYLGVRFETKPSVTMREQNGTLVYWYLVTIFIK